LKVSTPTPRLPRLIVPALLILPLGGCAKQDGPRRARPEAAHAPQPITTKSGVEMVLIPAGAFLMGDDRGEADEGPARRVSVSAFYIDTCEVTQEHYRQMIGKNPAKFPGPEKPVERLSWYAATQYCNVRSPREGFTPCYDPQTLECDWGADGYRLPTEAGWECACRAGTTTAWSFGNDPAKLVRYAWFKKNAGKTTHPVKQKAPNPWDLHDMHGNVSEWCKDFHAESYDRISDREDPRGPASGEQRVLRGGSWATGGASCRSSARQNETPGFADVCFGYEAYGFRCVRRALQQGPPSESD